MSALWWIVLGAVLVACPIAAGIYLGKARESGETEKLADAFADMEREVGAALEPILQRMADALARWRHRG